MALQALKGQEKMRTFIISIGLALALLTGPASAEPSADNSSGNAIMLSCRSVLEKVRTKPHFDASKSANKEEQLCIDLVAVVDAFDEQHEVCIPKTATMGQKIAVVVKYIDEHPEDMHLEFMFLAHEALAKAWPCEGGEK